MLTLNLINSVLHHIGEQSLATSAGTLGSLARTAIQSALTKVVQETRASFFEQVYTITATNDDYTVPAGQLSTQIAQVYDVVWNHDSNIIRMMEQPFERLDVLFGYSIIGNNLYVTRLLNRPIDLQIRALVIPFLPEADDVDSGIPVALQPAVIHQAASILLVTYMDDANAAAIQQRMADTLIATARGQLGITRGRQFNMAGNN